MVLVSIVAAAGLATACSESSEEDAQTPADAPTVANSALQTDSEGKTITAPTATAPADTSGGEPAAPGAGDAAAGETVFAGTCGGCHADGGKAAGVGPQLAGVGLDQAAIVDVLENGRPGTAMAGGLVSGDDLENVTAYVLSLQ